MPFFAPVAGDCLSVEVGVKREVYIFYLRRVLKHICDRLAEREICSVLALSVGVVVAVYAVAEIFGVFGAVRHKLGFFCYIGHCSAEIRQKTSLFHQPLLQKSELFFIYPMRCE